MAVPDYALIEPIADTIMLRRLQVGRPMTTTEAKRAVEWLERVSVEQKLMEWLGQGRLIGDWSGDEARFWRAAGPRPELPEAIAEAFDYDAETER